jgi:Skp family chaperone for outer membrane proteins
MKYFATVALMMTVCGMCIAGEQKIAVVDMNELLKSHPETEQAEAVLEETVKEIEAEKEKLMSKLEGLRDEVEGIMNQAKNRALSDGKRKKLKSAAEEKYKELRKMDFQAKKTMSQRKMELNEQKMMMHKRIVEEISEKVAKYADKKGYAFVLDKAGIGMSGMPAVIHADEDADITDAIKKLLAKD